jgi:acetyltransferase-like isoleucine patch superfamily enzyme
LKPINTLIWILENLRDREQRKEYPKIVIPFGRHSYGPQPEILYLKPYTLPLACGSRIGNFCSIAYGLKFIFVSKHNYNLVTTYPFYAFYDKWNVNLPPVYVKGVYHSSKLKPNPIIIENDVWIASNVTVKEGVTIHNGAVVAMESLVTKDVPPYAVVGGCPARIIKYRFNPNQIIELLKIAWWNWTDEETKEVLPLLISEDIDAFIRTAKNIKERKNGE